MEGSADLCTRRLPTASAVAQMQDSPMRNAQMTEQTDAPGFLLSIMLPVYNERSTIQSVLDAVLAAPQVHVCENPAVVAAAADMLGSDCAPLVCTEGIPSTAALELLDRICSGGASLRVQCDFDWGGLRIGNLLHQQFDAAPWRLTGRQYRRLLSGQRPRTPLRGTPEDASWDPGLRPALEAAGLALFEEQLLDELLGDLGGAARR